MTLRRRYLLGPAVLLALPLLILVVISALFLVYQLPRLDRAEKSRVTSEYREFAERLAEGVLPSFAYERQPGERQSGKLGGVPWGRVPEGERTLVWVGAGDDCRAVRVDAVFTVDTVLWGVLAVAAVLLLALVMTGTGIWFFWRHARGHEDFLAATIHDLKTPLVALRYLIPSQPETAALVNERLLRLVANLQTFLELGGRHGRPEALAFDLGAAFDEAYRLFAAEFAAAPSGAVVRVGPADVRARGDATLTVQVLWNLLGNALKYGAPYGPVTVTFAAGAGRVTVAVADVGPGMRPRQLKRAFDRYYRAQTALESGKGGFGIGLTNAREAVRAMGGELTVRANVPRGCVFTLTLKAAEEGR